MIVWIIPYHTQLYSLFFFEYKYKAWKKTQILDDLRYLTQLCFGIMSETTGLFGVICQETTNINYYIT